VGISLLLLAQSPLVEDLGISGAVRENFSRIALDERTVQTMIDSEREKERKAALQAAFREMDRPAAAQIGHRCGCSIGVASHLARHRQQLRYGRGGTSERAVRCQAFHPKMPPLSRYQLRRHLMTIATAVSSVQERALHPLQPLH
jgi:hypothetical protein